MPDNKKTPDVQPQNIHILGTSAQSLYLGATLQRYGHRVTVLCRPQEADEYNATDIIIKETTRLQSRRCRFFCTFEQTASPDLLIIGSDSPNLRSDLLLLSPSKIKAVPIVTLQPEVPTGLISETLGLPIVKAYFDSWLQQNKNHVSLFSASSDLVFSLPPQSRQMHALADIFDSAAIATKASENDAVNYWNWLSPRALALIFGAGPEKSVARVLKKTPARRTLEQCLDEIAELAAVDNVILNNQQIINVLHKLPENCSSPLLSDSTPVRLLRLQRLSAMLFRSLAQSDHRAPLLRRQLMLLANNP